MSTIFWLLGMFVFGVFFLIAWAAGKAYRKLTGRSEE